MIEALLTSVDEPQLDRCLRSINEQTVPFSNIVHINNVFPYSKAYNRGLSQVKDKWFMTIGGDFILDPDAVEKVTKGIEEDGDVKTVGHLYGIYDTFLHMDWNGVGTFRTDVAKSIPFRDRLDCERILGKKLNRMGWILRRGEGNLATHFDSPDEFQVFRRFYVYGLKYNGNVVSDIGANLDKLFEKTGNPLYKVAIKAIAFSGKKRTYPGSHNINFDRKTYEEFNAIQKA